METAHDAKIAAAYDCIQSQTQYGPAAGETRAETLAGIDATLRNRDGLRREHVRRAVDMAVVAGLLSVDEGAEIAR